MTHNLDYRGVVPNNGGNPKLLAVSEQGLGFLEGNPADTEFVSHVLFREFAHSIEERLIDPSDDSTRIIASAAKEVRAPSDHTRLKRAMALLRFLKSSLRNHRFKYVGKRIENLSATFLVERVARRPFYFHFDGAYSRRIAILEDTVSDPFLSENLVTAFVDRVNHLKGKLGITHLVFIQKDAGSVGALVMMSSLVSATKMPACIFRVSNGKLQEAQNPPGRHDRMAIIHDRIRSGDSITGVADAIRGTTEASTAAAIVLRAYGERSTGLRSPEGQEIQLEALDWDDEPASVTSFASRDESGDRNSSDPVTPQEENMTTREIPPGYYTLGTMPQISEGAQRILARIRGNAPSVGSTSDIRSTKVMGGIKLRDSGKAVGLKLKDSGKPLGLRIREST